MHFRNFISITIITLFTHCATTDPSINNKKNTFKEVFSNRGFALIYDPKYYNEGLVTKKIEERSLIIFQKNLKINTHVKVTNILNNKSLIAKVGKDSNYPLFNNSVLSKRIADELNLDNDEPYVEIKQISESSMFIAKKAKMYEEERNVATTAPVKDISINDLNKTDTNIEKKHKQQFFYEIKIADFYFNDMAKVMVDRIVNETQITNAKIKKMTIEKYRVYLGPFTNIKSLQKSFNDISILNFENIEIIKND